MRSVTTSTLLFIVLCLAGCASARPSVKTTFSLTDAGARNHGLVIGSVSTDTPKTSVSANTGFYLNDAAQGTRGEPHMLSPDFQVSSYCLPKERDFDEGCGHLFAIELPAGDYDLGWMIYPDVGIAVTVQPVDWPPVSVHVQAGKATYIGNIHMMLGIWGTVVGKEANWGWPVVTDQTARDIPMLLHRYPLLKQGDIDEEIPVLPSPGDTVLLPGPQFANPPANQSSN